MNRAAFMLVLSLLASAPALAGFRCGSKLINEGATRSEVAAKCGEPTEVVTHQSLYRRPMIWNYGRPYYVGNDYLEVPVESWIYNLGPNKLMRRLRFEDGIVVEIETLGYGYNP